MADAGLARFSNHAQRLMRLQRCFETATPLAQQSRVANLKLGRILIYAATSAVAAKLRQIEPRLVRVFQAEAAEVTGIEIRVQPSRQDRRAEPPPKAAIIGDHQKQGLTSLADRLPDGSPLKGALRRLVGRN